MAGQPGKVFAIASRHSSTGEDSSFHLRFDRTSGGTMSTISEKLSNASKLVRQTIGSALSSVHAGEDKIASRKTHAGESEGITLTSTAFGNGERIPKRFTPQGDNISPPLAWSGVPASAHELVLIVEDPDAPFPSPFVHWILHRLPASVTSLSEAIPNQRELAQLRGAVQGENGAKTRGWFGPQPPLGHGLHHYHFQLFALDTQLSLGPDATVEELTKALKGHVLADGEIVGTYERTATSD
jgi:Raf kinase inhibitor-like YbhB/YbcL family protein